jgi:hypothetical protein
MNKNEKIKLRLEKTKVKVAKNWIDRKAKKEKIVNSRRIGSLKKQELIKQLTTKTRQKNSTAWGNYSGYKTAIKKGSEFSGLTFEKRFIQPQSQSDIYKLKSINRLEPLMQKLFNKKSARYVLVTLKIKRNDIITYYSDSFTFTSYEQLTSRGENIYEKVLEKISFNSNYDGFELLSVHLRVIYENPKNNKIKNKNRKPKT